MLPDPFEQYYSHLPWFLQFPIYILLNVVLIRGIIGNGIMSEITQRGWLDHHIVKRTMKHLNSWTVIARKTAIVDHFRGGHSHDIQLCGEGRCAIL